MGDLQAMTLTGQETTLPAAAVAAFQQSLRGPLIAPDDARYAEARQVQSIINRDTLHITEVLQS
jgi:hypothetical protein